MSIDFINLCYPPVKRHNQAIGLKNERSNHRMTFHLTYAIVYCSCKKYLFSAVINRVRFHQASANIGVGALAQRQSIT